MRINSDAPKLTEIARSLVEEYAKFLGVEEDVFDIGVNVDYGFHLTYYELQKEDNRLASIRLTKFLSKALGRIDFSHEVRHILHEQVVRSVIEEDPVRFMRYFDETYHGNDPESIAELLKSYGVIDRGELIQKVTGLDRTNRSELENNLNAIESLYHEIMSQERVDLRESFADNSTCADRLSKVSVISSGAYTVLMYGHCIYSIIEGNTKGALIYGIGMIGLAAIIALQADLWKSISLNGDQPYTKDFLGQFPIEDRKYILALPPIKGTDIQTHIENLKSYGFPIKYQGNPNPNQG